MRLFLWLQSSPFIIYPRTHCGLSVLSVWVIKPSWVNINYYSIRLIKRREEYWAGGSIPLPTLSNLKQYLRKKENVCCKIFFMENYEAVTLSSSLLGVRNGHKYGDISSAGWETGGGRVDLSRNWNRNDLFLDLRDAGEQKKPLSLNHRQC